MKKEKKRTTHEAALQLLGYLFTQLWMVAESATDPKINGFFKNAESCRQKARSWVFCVCTYLIILTVGAAMGLLALSEYSANGWESTRFVVLAGGCLASLVAGTIWLHYTRINYPGRTTLRVAKDWGAVRRQCVKSGLLGALRLTIELESGDDADVIYDYPQPRLNLIQIAVDDRLKALAYSIKEDERDGFDRRVEKTRQQFAKIHATAKELSLKVNDDWGFYFQ